MNFKVFLYFISRRRGICRLANTRHDKRNVVSNQHIGRVTKCYWAFSFFLDVGRVNSAASGPSKRVPHWKPSLNITSVGTLLSFLATSVSFPYIPRPPYGGTLVRELTNIASAPLKPQQRLKILRCFLVPRFYHQLVLSRCYLQTLKSPDRQVRAAVRKWLWLPKDVPIGYFHARCLDGGLGIPSF
uniref:Uncharacterized protein n=1 Tax=Trichogramma kaykai TaxID=54128 RepID=A0ABD2WAI5_9HYME